MDSAVVTGAFTLGGVALGAVLEWARSVLAARQAAADERDQLFAGLGSACTRLLVQARIIRTLDKPSTKLRQLTHGLMEGEARHPVVLSRGLAVAVRQMMASAAANGLGHLSPVSMADRINRDLLPIMSEIAVLAIRLSMTGDEGLKDATNRVTKCGRGAVVRDRRERTGLPEARRGDERGGRPDAPCPRRSSCPVVAPPQGAPRHLGGRGRCAR